MEESVFQSIKSSKQTVSEKVQLIVYAHGQLGLDKERNATLTLTTDDMISIGELVQKLTEK